MTDLQGAGAPPHPAAASAAAAAGASAGDDATAHAALGALRARVLAAAASRTPLRVRGGGTKDFYGQAFDGDVLDTRAYRGIVSFEPTELVVTARCGTPLSELQAVLAEHRQMLAFEPPAFGPDATVGGVVSAGLSGPRRAASGAARDFVLGAVLLDGAGRLKVFGGQVMKNVAGYDVSRLLCGALGTLGVVTEVSLKVLPVPPAEATLSMTVNEADALRLLNEWGGLPLPISASGWHGSRLRLRFSGARAAVEAAVRRFESTYAAVPVGADEAAGYWAGLREQTDDFFSGDEPLWRMSVPSTAPAFNFPGRQLIEWGGALRWLKTGVDAATLRRAAEAVGGTATLFRGGDRSVGVFQPLSAAVLEIHRRLKHEFDPDGIFNPGRMYAGL
ncbi:MAG TPA: glycolate oxidase subunit GlcE [Quisquiliibacterium sp.]|nr:glycolate oxidase subunit GlcE [Quisquiliibacterium sp.]